MVSISILFQAKSPLLKNSPSSDDSLASCNSLLANLKSSSVAVPHTDCSLFTPELVERQQDRERDETNVLIAFHTDRGVGYKYRPKKKGKKSQNINFETSDQFTQSGLTESRKVEWNKWKHFNA